MRVFSSFFQIRISLYTSGEEVMHILFDAVGSDIDTWFKQHRILSSSYSSEIKTESIQYFTSKG